MQGKIVLFLVINAEVSGIPLERSEEISGKVYALPTSFACHLTSNRNFPSDYNC